VKARKVRLYIRVRLVDGRSVFVDPVWNRNRTLRAGYALIDGVPEHHPEGCYYLRFLRWNKRVRQAVGQDADAAMVALHNREHDLQSISLGRTIAEVPVFAEKRSSSASVSLAQAIQTYLVEVRQFRSVRTVKACERMLSLFGSRFEGRAVKSITRKDLLDHMVSLKAGGLGDRTIHNHIARIGTLLKANGVVGLLSHSDKPRYDEREVEAYNSEQLARLFTAASPEERVVFEFFLGTGLREGEVMYTTWKNIDFIGGVVSVRSKSEMGFRIKDKEERSVPVPDSLIASMVARKKHSTSVLVFPGTNGKPNGHFLRMLQLLAFRAGMNCGECVTKGGKSCTNHPVCGAWGLHKFRKTFATMHSEAGVSPRTIQRWLGHSDLATTLRYLAAADIRSERTRSQVNASFSMLAVGGVA
jgi:integrase/recombinase XerD